MAERDHLVIELTKELLGPRDGQFEQMPSDHEPRDEYIVGVLAPALAERVQDDPDADADEAIEEISDDENQGAEGVVIAPPSAFSPALDPKAQPRSIGLTFMVVADEGVPQIDICATWARYQPQANGNWQREPIGTVLRAIETTEHGRWEVGLDVDLYMRVRQQANRNYRVSLYLVNQRAIPEGQRPTSSDYVFQPQIRVHCVAGTHLTSMVNVSPIVDDLTREDAQLAMLYRRRVALARGHMCGATWRDIDPERPHPELQSPPFAPFSWTDQSRVTEAERALFTPADVRTELLPCYPIESPPPEWLGGDQPAPELNPLVLAEAWAPEIIRTYLEPLVQSYLRWINAQQQEVAGLQHEWQPLAAHNLDRCMQAARRMQAGIESLVQDEAVRLSFCFANQAIALQSMWARKGRVVSWRPFQLAFILLNIPAFANPLDTDRQICDLLWFPTGGGKTEAYLGLAAFTLALRRQRAADQSEYDHNGNGVSVLSRYTLRLLTIQQFRRALGIITACEQLRVTDLADPTRPTGWRPQACLDVTPFLCGEAPSSP